MPSVLVNGGFPSNCSFVFAMSTCKDPHKRCDIADFPINLLAILNQDAGIGSNHLVHLMLFSYYLTLKVILFNVKAKDPSWRIIAYASALRLLYQSHQTQKVQLMLELAPMIPGNLNNKINILIPICDNVKQNNRPHISRKRITYLAEFKSLLVLDLLENEKT